MLRRILMISFVLFSFSLAQVCFAKEQQSKEGLKKVFLEGKHYDVLKVSLPTNLAPVMEFIYFGCRSCYQLVPAIGDWSRSSGIDVVLTPVHTETQMLDEARMFHSFDQMGVLPTMYELGYVIFQTQESKLQGEARVNSFLEQNKVDRERFWEAWSSEGVNRRLQGSALLTKQAGIYKTPSFVVHGKYRIDVDSLTSVEELFELLEYLVKEKAPSPSLVLKKPL